MKIAIIGTGISGLGAAWLISKKHNITIFEKNNRIGGHSNTLDINYYNNNISVDTGFIVYNKKNYPNFVNLLQKLNVPTERSNMSFSVSFNNGEFEYEGSLVGVFSKLSNIYDKRFISMLFGILRFYNFAKSQSNHFDQNTNLREFLIQYKYSDEFIKYHLLPMCSSIWSSPKNEIMKYPIKSLIRFMDNHQLLNFFTRPKWRTIKGGSKNYIKKIQEGSNFKIIKNINIKSVIRNSDEVIIKTNDGREFNFDKIIYACSPKESIKMTKNIKKNEKQILEKFNFTKNKIYLHSDISLMPTRKLAWAAWNYLGNTKNNNKPTITYWMNKLQNIDKDLPLFVTLNPSKIPKTKNIFRELEYSHPVFDNLTMSSQKDLFKIQGKNNSYWCGAWTGNGFHEDGLNSAISVAKSLNVKIPWTNKIQSSENKR